MEIMKTSLELQSAKELRELATANGIELPTRCKKEEIIAILAEALGGDEEEAVETTNWFEEKISGRSLKKLTKEQLLQFPAFAGNEELAAEDEASLRSLVLATLKNEKLENDPLTLEKEENFNQIKALIFEKTEMGVTKLSKEQVASIRKSMQGKTYSKSQREEIKDMIDTNRLKMASKFILEDYFELKNAELVDDKVIHSKGELSHYEAAVRIGCRDYGENLAYSIKKLIDGEYSTINALEAQDRYTEMSYEILLNGVSEEKQALVISEIERLFDLDNYPMDYNQMNLDPATEPGCEIQMLDAIGKPHRMRVVVASPLIVQPWTQYFMGDCAHVDKRYWKFDKVLKTKLEVFEQCATTKYLEEKYDATKDPAITPSIMSEEVID